MRKCVAYRFALCVALLMFTGGAAVATVCITEPAAGPGNYVVTVDVGQSARNIDYSAEAGQSVITTDYGSGSLVKAIGTTFDTMFSNSKPDDVVADPNVMPHTNPAYKLSYTTLYYSDAVVVTDIVTSTTIKTIAVGRNPRGLAIDDANRLLFVANQGGRSISVIDINKANGSFLTVKKTVALNGSPQYLAADPVNRLLYIGMYDTKAVGVMDTETLRMLNLYQGAACGGPAPYTAHIYLGTVPGHLTYGSLGGADEVFAVDTSNNLWELKAVKCGAGVAYYSKNSIDLTYGGQQCGAWDVAVDEFANACPAFMIAGNPVVRKLYISCQTAKKIAILDATTPLNAGSILKYADISDCTAATDVPWGIAKHPLIACKYYAAFESGIMCDALTWKCVREQVDICFQKHKADPITYNAAALDCAVCCYSKQSYTDCQPAFCP